MIHCEKFDSSDFNWARIAAQVARLEGLDKFPFGVEAKRELCLALLTADTVDQAKQVIDGVMIRTEDNRCPTPPDLRRMIAAEQERGRSTADDLLGEFKRENKKPATCVVCRDFGIAESIDSNDIRSIASYCTCSIGRTRSSRPDPYSPTRVNAARAKLIARKTDVPKPGPGRKRPTYSPGAEPLKGTGTDNENYQGEF